MSFVCTPARATVPDILRIGSPIAAPGVEQLKYIQVLHASCRMAPNLLCRHVKSHLCLHTAATMAAGIPFSSIALARAFRSKPTRHLPMSYGSLYMRAKQIVHFCRAMLQTSELPVIANFPVVLSHSSITIALKCYNSLAAAPEITAGRAITLCLSH